MKRVLAVLTLFSLLLATGRAQFASFGDQPVEVDAESTRFSSGMAIAERNVIIRYGDTVIYADYAEYSPDTHDALVRGNVRVYRGPQTFTAERGLYNFETKVFRAADFRGEGFPFRFSGDTVGSMGPNAYLVRNGIFTTSDSSKPDFFLRAKNVRIYTKDRVIFSNVTLYFGQTPVFWWPYLYQSLKDENAFTATPGYKSDWGAFLLTTYKFPITDSWSGKLHTDFYSDRGIGHGFDSEFSYGKNNRDTGRFRSYYIADSQSDSTGANGKGQTSEGRYRVSLQHRLYFTDDVYANIDLNLLSDRNFLEDFSQGSFRKDPQPDNMISVTKVSENYSITLITRKQLNDWQEVTERLPEVVMDVKRTPLWSTGLFYEAESSVGYLNRNFPTDSIQDFDTIRLDTFHQVTYPQTYFGWLNVVPRLGMRTTFYSKTGQLNDIEEVTRETLADGSERERIRRETVLDSGGSTVRGVFNTGFEASYKFSKEWEVQSRAWGLDGMRHVVQPYTNLSIALTTEDPSKILQIDRFIPNTEPPPLDFPQFDTIDSIPDWTIWRWGVRNRWQTRRDNRTINWLETDTFLDVNIMPPDFPGAQEPGTLSNLVNSLRWRPLPWLNVRLDSQLPLDNGFVQFNSRISFMVSRDLELSLGHRYIADSPYFRDDNSVSVGGYYRIDDNWAFSFADTYEFQSSTLQRQQYQIHRDLSSWVASLGFLVRENADQDEYGLLLTFTLKDLPQLSLPISFDPQGQGEE